MMVARISRAVTVGMFLLTFAAQGYSKMDKSVISVWATDDGVRVDPLTGKYLEDRPDIFPEYPTGDYQSHNLLWDKEKQTVTLHGGRNEFVAFQVVVAADTPVKGVKVKLNRLTGPGGARISGKAVALMKAWYVKVEKPSHGFQKTSLGPGWYADGLLPAETDGSVTLNIPEPRNHIGATQKNHSVWVDIFVRRDREKAPPGEYKGRLTVTAGDQKHTVNVVLNVWDFALPDEIHCRGDIWNGSLRRMDPDMEMRYYQMAHRHRFHPGVAGYRPKVQVEQGADGPKVTIDWTEYDRRLAKYFNGEAFTKKHGYWGPGYGHPIPHIQLPFNCNKRGRKGGWPVVMEGWKLDAEGEAIWLEACRQFRAHFDADPTWRKVKRVVFLGGLDESYNQKAYDAMIYFSKLTRRGLGNDWFQYRIDGGYNSPAMRQLHPYVDLWVCHTAGWHQPKMLNFRGKGVETWFYGPMVYERKGNSGTGSNTFTDLDVLVNRGIGWVAWKHRSGYCQWEFDAHYIRDPWQGRPKKAWDKRWTEACNFRRQMGGGKYQKHNGSGLLTFRGELAGRPGEPIPTIRLKAQRRGMQDYEYFWLLREAGKGKLADKLVDSIIRVRPFGAENYRNPNVWTHNPQQWDAVRIAAGEALHVLAKK
ncbi:MAG: hypothetical protein ACYS5V_04360 [Planctomycetota bacterium]|jgi:hypothetical protein